MAGPFRARVRDAGAQPQDDTQEDAPCLELEANEPCLELEANEPADESGGTLV